MPDPARSKGSGREDSAHRLTLPGSMVGLSACLTDGPAQSPYALLMSGVLHPEGPEPVQTYWLRRVLVLLALVLLVMISLGLARASSGATRVVAAPSPTPVPTLSASPTSSSVPAVSASPTPTTSSPAARSSAAAVRFTPNCARNQLSVSVGGKQMLTVAQPTAFTVTVRNGGDDACLLNLAKIDFELRVASGKQLVWSSRACSTATFAVAAKLELDQSVSWVMGWDGRETRAGCTQAGPALKSGTYVATAQMAGAKAASLPITLRS